MGKKVEFSIGYGDIRYFQADVVALTFAGNFYGADEDIAYALQKAGISYENISPQIGDTVYIDSGDTIKAPHVMFIGVPDLVEFGYDEIRRFAVTALTFLSREAPTTKHLAMTIHGFGLDEIESLKAQFTGCMQAFQGGNIPPGLEKISIVEFIERRVERLRLGFEKSIIGMENVSKVKGRWAYRLDVPSPFEHGVSRSFRGLETKVEPVKEKYVVKPHVFVAMPFRKDMEDVFYYGIQRAAHANNLLCERIDQEAFTGDIIARVKKKIETAAVVIAELSGANPNVYLEVGYAWGKEVPTVLLVKKAEELRFDVRGQRCLEYEIIRELEESLTKELKGLLGKK